MDFSGGFNFSVVPTEYKREDYKRTKYDAVFSQWKVLIGSNDWDDFNKCKDGVGRYRVENLPRKSKPGLYELGVAIISQDQSRKLESDDVLSAYLGQAESVRSRLQSYGRSGSHLRNVHGCCDVVIDKKAAVTAALFEDVFSKQGSLLYRWAPMGSKREAEATEGMLLSTFDYAWNKGSNGERRHLDLLKKLDDRGFLSKRKSGIPRELFPFLENQVGIKIKGEKRVPIEERKLGFDDDVVVDEEKSSNTNTNSFLTSILKLTRSRPQIVPDRFDGSSCPDSVCGVILENGGGCCSKSPVKGRKRCLEHKGQRVCRVSPEKQKPTQPEIVTGKDHNHKNSDVLMCGVILPNMEACVKRPVKGRKRCEDHKGMRINAFLFLLNQTDREKTVKDEKSDPDISGEEACTRFCGKKVVACGIKLCNGLVVCERSPVKGCKRCQEHKGMRIS
ncbi:unnamed protein product [Cochlearia groenlandica]